MPPSLADLTDNSLVEVAASWLSIFPQRTLEAVKPFGLGNKEALRCKNMWTLGLALWMFDRDRAAAATSGCDDKFAKNPILARRQYRRAECGSCIR